MNYVNTFIAVAADSKAKAAKPPAPRAGAATIAALEYALIAPRPYALTQEEVQFAVHAQRQQIAAEELAAHRERLWQEFFSKPMACMRCSPLAKSHGWGLHFNEEGKVALVAVESPDYQRLSQDPKIEQTRAMRSKRA